MNLSELERAYGEMLRLVSKKMIQERNLKVSLQISTIMHAFLVEKLKKLSIIPEEEIVQLSNFMGAEIEIREDLAVSWKVTLEERE